MGRLTGWAAIRFAEVTGFSLSKHNDPTEPERDGLTIEEAEEVAREDDNLIYLDPPIFCRARKDGNYQILNSEDGSRIARLPGCHPVGSDKSGAYEHPEGIVLDRAQVDALEIEIEED